MDALLAAVENIEAHYTLIEAKAGANPASSKYDYWLNLARGYPLVKSYKNNGQEIDFTYSAWHDEEKLIFSAITNEPNSRECIVKFTWQYSEAAHNYLASRGLSPMLRQGGFVHGDIRDINLLVDPQSLASEEVKVQLIDFDWAERIGEVKYPIDINCKTVKLPEGVKGRELITEEHDYEMVAYLWLCTYWAILLDVT